MPIYEFKCNNCKKEFSTLVFNTKDKSENFCPQCNGKELTRLISRVSFFKTESQRLKEFNTGKHRGEDFYKDPRNLGLWAKKKAQELGAGDLGPKFEEKLERARSGKIFEDMDI